VSLLSLFDVLKSRRFLNKKYARIALWGNADHGSTTSRPAKQKITQLSDFLFGWEEASESLHLRPGIEQSSIFRIEVRNSRLRPSSVERRRNRALGR